MEDLAHELVDLRHQFLEMCEDIPDYERLVVFAKARGQAAATDGCEARSVRQ